MCSGSEIAAEDGPHALLFRYRFETTHVAYSLSARRDHFAIEGNTGSASLASTGSSIRFVRYRRNGTPESPAGCFELDCFKNFMEAQR